jgi:hypothetical protein
VGRATLLRAVLPLVLAAVLGGSELPREVVRSPRPADPLAPRWDWARAEARTRAYRTGYWVAYAISRLTGESSHIGSFDFGSRKARLTLGEIVAGTRLEASTAGAGRSVRETARSVLEDMEREKGPEKKVRKDLALLYRYKDAGAGPEEVAMSDMDLVIDLKGLPLLWLGAASNGDSLALVRKLHSDGGPADFREDLMAAAGVHDAPDLVIPFLDGVLKGGGEARVRKEAAFWIGQQGGPAALRILRDAARTDRSAEVRKNAVFAISQVELEAAVDALIELAKAAGEAGVRREAVFWLGQKASKKAEAALVGFVYDAAELEVREQAVFALSQLPDNQGVEPLIRIVRSHPDSRVRAKAAFWLGECDDPRALDALIAVVKD